MAGFCVGIIPDGNRRYAKKKGISTAEGYAKGIDVAKEALDFLREETDVTHVYFYTLSRENILKRSSVELNAIFGLLKREADRAGKDLGVSVRIMGDLSILPADVRDALKRVEKNTEENGPPHVALAVGYTGREEIVHAARKIAEAVRNGVLSPDEITEDVFYRYLYLPDFPPPDLIIRTSGEHRTSGFLPFQAVYSELVFYPKLWPEMTRDDFRRILEEYGRRERRFGA